MAFVFMAKKTIGRMYWLKDDEHPRGYYYFSKYCNCGRYVYMTEYEAAEFIDKASGWVDRRSFWKKLWSKIPRIKFVVQKGGEEKKMDRVLTN